MNNRLSLFTSAALAALVLPLSLQAYTATINGIEWTYTVSGGKASVDGASPSSGNLSIPATLGGYPVNAIGDWAFYGCRGLTSVTIPNSVTTIGENAFEECYGLRFVTIPNSVTTIGDFAFEYCIGITSVTIGNSVARIGDNAFRYCDSLTSVTIPRSVTTIGQSAFAYCDSLGSIAVDAANAIFDSRNNCNAIIRTADDTLLAGCKNTTIPNSVTTIGDFAFDGCRNLNFVTIPNSVTTIGDWAFDECYGLTSVTIPNSVTTIGDDVFSCCSRLQTIYLPKRFKGGTDDMGIEMDCSIIFYTESTVNGVKWTYIVSGGKASVGSGSWTLTAVPKSTTGAIKIPSSLGGYPVTSIGEEAFYYCEGLTSVTIPDGVTSIGYDAFYGCKNLKTVTMPSSVWFIDEESFAYCDLTSVFISDAVSYIGQGAFKGCDSLTSIRVAASNPVYDSRGGCNAIVRTWDDALVAGCRNTTIPSTVASIGYAAFLGCPTLTSVSIPESVTSIGDRAFESCSNLKTVIIPCSVTTIGFEAFVNCCCLKTAFIPSRLRNQVESGDVFDACPNVKIVYYNGKWPTYKVKFNANGGELPKGKKMAAQTMTYGKAAKLRKNVFTRTGWIFAGWATSKANAKKGIVAYRNAQSVKNVRADGKTATLYAVWAKKTYKVAFYANGGKGTMAVESFTYGKAKKLSANKFKAPKGKMFAGWATIKANAKKGVVKYKNKQSVKNLVTTGKTVKLYAVWKKR